MIQNKEKMKRDYPQQDYTFFNGGSSTSASAAAAAAPVTAGFSDLRLDVTGKSKMWDGVEEQDAGDDELLAVLGYKVKSSDMADVAQKIEHLEGVLGNDDGLSQLASDSVHYNPSDLSSWLESMICELNPAVQQPIMDDSFVTGVTSTGNDSVTPSGVDSSSIFVDDLQAIPGNAIYPPTKKQKPSSPSTCASSSYNPNPIVLVDTQEIRYDSVKVRGPLCRES